MTKGRDKVYCTKCGKKNADDRLFCGFCGSPLNAPESAASSEDDERRLYGRPQAAEAPAAQSEQTARAGNAGVRAAGRGVSVPPRAPRKNRPRKRRPGKRRPREEEWPDLDFEPPVPPRPQFKPAPEAAEDEDGAGALEMDYGEAVDAPPEEDVPAPGDADDPLARPLLNRPVELRAKHPPAAFAPGPPRSSPARATGRAASQHRGAAARARPGRPLSGGRGRRPRTTSPTS